MIKITHASPGIGSSLSASQVNDFLRNSNLNLLLGTIDEKNEPNVHPVWYHYENEKLYVETSKIAKKAKNIRNGKNTVYFCIDDEKIPYKGVRGKAVATIIEDIPTMLPIAEKIMIKYTGDLKNNVAKFLLAGVKNGSSVLLELKPKYFATWNHSSAF